jgi:MFS transporter, SP family, arabinose:H+ symporter
LVPCSAAGPLIGSDGEARFYGSARYISSVPWGQAWPRTLVFLLLRVSSAGWGVAWPPKNRGPLAGMFQFNIVLGILIAFLSNALLVGIGDNSWRWMLGVAAFPSLLYALSCLALPESPRWLLSKKGDREAGMQVLQRIQPEATDLEIAAEADEIIAASAEKASSRHFWTRQLRKPILLAILIAFFNQMSGINAILYFGLWLIDRVGRRTLLYVGSFGYIASLSLVAWGFFQAHYSIVPVCVFAFIAAHAIGQGAVIWVFISEIFPNRHRAEGQTLGSFTHWIFAALLTTFFPKMVSAFPAGYVFSFFAGMMCLQLLWVKTMVPETKNVPLEEIQKELAIG